MREEGYQALGAGPWTSVIDIPYASTRNGVNSAIAKFTTAFCSGPDVSQWQGPGFLAFFWMDVTFRFKNKETQKEMLAGGGLAHSLACMNFQMFNLDLENAEEPEIKLPTSVGS